jgi:hypothetical protein
VLLVHPTEATQLPEPIDAGLPKPDASSLPFRLQVHPSLHLLPVIHAINITISYLLWYSLTSFDYGDEPFHFEQHVSNHLLQHQHILGTVFKCVKLLLLAAFSEVDVQVFYARFVGQELGVASHR